MLQTNKLLINKLLINKLLINKLLIRIVYVAPEKKKQNKKII